MLPSSSTFISREMNTYQHKQVQKYSKHYFLQQPKKRWEQPKCPLTDAWINSSHGKESACNAGDQGVSPGWGRSSGEGKQQTTPVFLLENPMNREAWRATVNGVTKSRTRLGD